VVIGTGASAIQFVPEIAHRVSQLHVYQRTAPWVLPKLDAPIPWVVQQVLHRVPLAERLLRGGVYAVHEAVGVAFRHEPLMRQVQQLARLHLYAQVRDGALRSTLTPDFTLGCKRILMSNDWYPALTRRTTTVHGCAVTGFTERGVIGADGEFVEADTVILGTGFEVTRPPIAGSVFDGEGRSLAQLWAGADGRRPGASAYLGTTIAGLPNLFLFLGPNIAPGHASVLATIELQARYTADAVVAMGANGWSSLEVRPDVERSFNERVQRALAPTVYNAGGCASYYLDDGGRNIANWPWSVARLHRELRFRPEDFLACTAARPRLVEVGA
jgi:cyclohexanone monooxygenase